MDQNHEYSMSRMMDDGSNHEGFFKGGNNNNKEAKIIICIRIQEVDSIIGAINKKRQNSQNIWGTICFVNSNKLYGFVSLCLLGIIIIA